MWQTASDFLVFLGWVFQNISLIVKDAFLPVRYVYTFLQQFFDSAFAPVVSPAPIWQFSDEILALFNAIPYFNVLIISLVLGLTILMAVFTLKTFLKS
jgi:hypothetical protein